MFRNLVMVLALATVALGAGGCHRKQSYAASPLLGTPVHIVVDRAYTDKERLYVEAEVTNVSDRPMMIERDGVQLALDDGHVLRRSLGTGKTYTIEPGRSRPIRVEFSSHDVKWRNVKHAQLEWSNAVSIEGRQVLIPPMALSALHKGHKVDVDD